MLELVALLACTVVGFALIALTQAQHRLRVAGAAKLSPVAVRVQRAFGLALLGLALPIAVVREGGGGFGTILWAVSLSAGALLVAAGLTWTPRAFGLLVRLGRRPPAVGRSGRRDFTPVVSSAQAGRTTTGRPKWRHENKRTLDDGLRPAEDYGPGRSLGPGARRGAGLGLRADPYKRIGRNSDVTICRNGADEPCARQGDA